MAVALLLIDLQSDRPLAAELIDLIGRGRRAGTEFVHVQHDGPAGSPDEPGTPGWQLALEPGPDDLVVRSDGVDPFAADGALADTLRDRAVSAVVLAGRDIDAVLGTARGALREGFTVTVVDDAPVGRIERELAGDGVHITGAAAVDLTG